MKTNFKYFIINSESNIDGLKKQFKKLAFQFHPDITGKDTNKEMQAVITEYEEALKEIGKIHNKNYTFDQEFVDIIDKIIKLNIQGIEIEVCGWFLYVWNVPKELKNMVNKEGIGLNWNPKKSCWYWKPVWYRKRNKDTWSMEKIRETWGSQIIEKEKQQKRILVTA